MRLRALELRPDTCVVSDLPLARIGVTKLNGFSDALGDDSELPKTSPQILCIRAADSNDEDAWFWGPTWVSSNTPARQKHVATSPDFGYKIPLPLFIGRFC